MQKRESGWGSRFGNDKSMHLLVLIPVLVSTLFLFGCADPASDLAGMSSFIFPAAGNEALSADVTATITDTAIAATVPYGTNVTALAATAAASVGAVISPDPAVAADYTSPVAFTVTAEDAETTAVYTVTVTIAPADASDEAAMSSFDFAAADNAALSADVTADIDGTAISASVPYGTDVTALIPTIAISAGATVNPASGTAGDFSSPVMYTVTAEDGVHSTAYLVTVTVEEFQEAENDFSSTPLQQLELATRENSDYLGGMITVGDPNGQIAFSEDGTVLVIGVPQFGPSNDGCAVVFEESGGTWTEAATLNGSLAVNAGDNMGNSVAISRDGSVIAVGAYLDEAAGFSSSGLVYLFVRSGSSWNDMSSETTRLNPADRANNDFFGTSVAVNTDGSVIAAGALAANGNGLDEGSAYVFLRPAGDWDTEPVHEEAARLRMSAAAGYDGSNLGESIEISADGSIVAAGAPEYARIIGNSGAVFVFTEPAGGWDDDYPIPTEVNETAVLTTETEIGSTYLGWDISMTGDGSIIAAGGRGYNNNGAVFVYRSLGTWADASEDQLITAYNGLSGDNFGHSVALSGSGGYLVAGAPYRDSDDSAEGAFYLYVLDEGSYTAAVPHYFTQMTLMGADSWFGMSLAISPDASTICIGAPGWDDTTPEPDLTDVGTAFIYQ